MGRAVQFQSFVVAVLVAKQHWHQDLPRQGQNRPHLPKDVK
jgi:hypothetical protein